MSNSTPVGRVVIRYKIHWHLLLTHFPISFFMVSAGFMILHLFTMTECFELSSYITLIAGIIMLIPTILTGWFSWRRNYQGARVRIFAYKIRIAYGMMALAIVLIALHSIFVFTEHTIWHTIYTIGFVLLFLGAMAEGYFGGRLNHR